MKFDKNSHEISLHGLGFIKVKLRPDMQMHVWHPTLPRRRNADVSVHNQRFNFKSLIVSGTLFNYQYDVKKNDNGRFVRFDHTGHRDRYGNHEWRRDGYRYDIIERESQIYKTGDTYFSPAYAYHRAEPGGINSVAVTLVQKFRIQNRAASTIHQADLPHDPKFDRFQMTDDEMWEIVKKCIFD